MGLVCLKMLIKIALFITLTMVGSAMAEVKAPPSSALPELWPAFTRKPHNQQQNITPREWKFAHPAPPVSHLPPIWQKGFSWFANKVNGKLTFKEYGGGTLYGFNGGVRAIRTGIADYGTCYSAAESRGFELLKTFQLPFVAPQNPYLTARLINELTAKHIHKEFTRLGVYPAHIAPVRPLTLMSKTPIKAPQDLKGKKVVSFMNTPGADKALGFAQVRMPFTEIYTALQQGLVDAVIWVDMGFIPFKIYEQAGYYTAINVAPLTVETCFNRRSFDQLDNSLKQQLYDFQQRLGIALVRETESFAQQARGLLQSHGVTVIELSDSDRRRWQSAFQPVVKQWLKLCEARGKDCQALIDDINQLKQKYAGYSNAALIRLAIEQPVQGMIRF